MMSDFARKLSRISRAASVNLMGTLVVAGALLAGGAYAAPAAAQSTKIGFVNTERILRESGPAKAAQAKIEAEFKRRDDDLQRATSTLRAQAEKYDKDAPVLSEGDRVKRQRDLSNSDADLQRRRREFQEDFNRRRNEEFSAIVEKANAAIKRIAETENYDLIVQDAVTVNPRVDITDRVIQALGK
ncbi:MULTISPECIES: OmpH family outer membrane protein [unclassified Achromobacter]|uniref:OmpH family outer membrane protein n=1 Tax=unclassified Achromobacter TaxID=2626865 RepID=UPI000B519B49|nr:MULTISPECIES: OmpH family outer membrane protein [unclassified Achromobacter]OWT80006.1 outer membrane protein chaperone [Achromobacter sp. HZ34]OWT81890.1 outer membrane protein chaperone [Achromobacter sp. HZ28]